jgi:hypothetical protein
MPQKKFNINYGVKIKAITNENLIQYTAELKAISSWVLTM